MAARTGYFVLAHLALVLGVIVLGGV